MTTRFTFESDASATYLVYRPGGEEKIDLLTLGMLTHGNMEGLCPAIYAKVGEDRVVKYNITGKTSADRLFAHGVTQKHLLGVLAGIAVAKATASEYMIDPAMLMLDPAYIYVNEATGKTGVICLPVAAPPAPLYSLVDYFKPIVLEAPLGAPENNGYVAEIVSYLESPLFSRDEFKALLAKLKAGGPSSGQKNAAENTKSTPSAASPADASGAEPDSLSSLPPTSLQQTSEAELEMEQRQTTADPLPVTIPVPEPGDIPEPNVDGGTPKMSLFYLLLHYSRENRTIYKAQRARRKATKKSLQTGEDTTSEDYEGLSSLETGEPTPILPHLAAGALVAREPQGTAPAAPVPLTVAPFFLAEQLGGSQGGVAPQLNNQNATPFLLRKKNQEAIPLTKGEFCIGKEKMYADYVVRDNPAISRSHVYLVQKGNVWFVVDTNSTNHTFVDGILIQSGEERQISNGNSLRLANEDFVFYDGTTPTYR